MKRVQHKHKKAKFWNREYEKRGAHFALSENPSEDLATFTRWLVRDQGNNVLTKNASVLDVGCGNGRNLIYLSREFGVKGIGYDNSNEAIASAKKLSEDLPISYEIRSVTETLPLPDNSQTLVLDMMVSHVLSNSDREKLHKEIARVLKPGGFLFLKTFLRDEDRHAERLLRDHPGTEKGSYIHPDIGVQEHVFSEDEIVKELETNFIVHKIKKSHRHIRNGKAFKRRSISLYAQKAFD